MSLPTPGNSYSGYAQNYVPMPTPGALNGTLSQLLQNADYLQSNSFADSANLIQHQMAQRGIRAGGAHQQSLTDLMKNAAYANNMARAGIAGQVYQLGQQDWSLFLQDLARAGGQWWNEQSSRDQMSANNQAGRSAAWGALGGLAGTMLGGGAGGGGFTGLSNMLGLGGGGTNFGNVASGATNTAYDFRM